MIPLSRKARDCRRASQAMLSPSSSSSSPLRPFPGDQLQVMGATREACWFGGMNRSRERRGTPTIEYQRQRTSLSSRTLNIKRENCLPSCGVRPYEIAPGYHSDKEDPHISTRASQSILGRHPKCSHFWNFFSSLQRLPPLLSLSGGVSLGSSGTSSHHTFKVMSERYLSSSASSVSIWMMRTYTPTSEALFDMCRQ